MRFRLPLLALVAALAALGAARLLPRAEAAPVPDAFSRTLVIHHHGIEIATHAAGAPLGCLLVKVRDLGPGVPGLTEDLPPTDATLRVNGAVPVALDPAGPGELVGVLPLALLRPWFSDDVRLEVLSDARLLVTLELDLLLP
jgi:hypothetical protein